MKEEEEEGVGGEGVSGGGKQQWQRVAGVVRKNFMLASLKVCYLFKAVQTFAERWQARNVCESCGSVAQAWESSALLNLYRLVPPQAAIQ